MPDEPSQPTPTSRKGARHAGEQADAASIAEWERDEPRSDFRFVDGKLVEVPAPTPAR